MSEELDNGLAEGQEGGLHIKRVSGMYKDWFLDYASYVILERAVPHVHDGLKPVQRRLLHSLKELDDGRYHKVANLIGHTMKYHPHGDASIGDALVQLGQKELLIDTQGNWGNILTGDSAAAPRYIEARLSKFALEVVYNPKNTRWQASYDGRGKEPITLPVKFPLLLAQGVEGIAVGLSTKIMPHNFVELIDGSIDILKGKKVKIYPDFPTGGIADFTNYNDGERGGRIKVRASILIEDKNTLRITEIPFGTNTGSLIDSIIKANDKGKIKIKKIEDNTAENVDIYVHLAPGISPDKTIDALYAFTDCEVSISPNCCVISDESPLFCGVSELLRLSTEHTLALLKSELEIQLDELEEQWHFANLERIFIEKRIYRDIEEEETWEGVIRAIDEGLKPHIGHLKRAVTEEDIVRLTEIRIKRISKFDLDKAKQFIEALEDKIAGIKHHLANLVEYAIDYFKGLKDKYKSGRERKTEIRLFDEIVATKVAIANEKLYINREEGFIGTSLKKDEFICDCSDIDDIIIFREDGTMQVTKVDKKVFVGQGILYANVWKKNDERTVYNMVYRDGAKGPAYMKRFSVTGITRDKEYHLTQGKPNSEVLYFSANPNGEAEMVTVYLKANPRLKKLHFTIDFADLAIKNRSSKGNLVSKFPVKKIEMKEEGMSTLGAQKVWYDDTVQKLNTEGRGDLLGSFAGDDRILEISQGGYYRLLSYDVTTHFDPEMIHIEKYNPNRSITAVYWEGEKERYYVKRFLPEMVDKTKKVEFISESPGSRLELVSTAAEAIIEVEFTKKPGKDRAPNELINLSEFIDIKGLKAQGNQLTREKVNSISLNKEIETVAVAAPATEVEFEVEINQPDGVGERQDSGKTDDLGQITLEL